MARLTRSLIVTLVLAVISTSTGYAQGIQSSPYASSSALRREAAGPSVSTIAPGNTKTLSEESTRRDIPNLQTGYTYYSGKDWRVGYFIVDYLHPFRVSENSIIFGTAHSEIQGNAQNLTARSDEKVFLSAGGGYRTVLNKKTLLGFSGFYDTAKFANQWVSSGGAGIEMAHLVAGSDAIDAHFNWYGDLAEGDLVNQYRNGAANYDIQVGYSHQLYNGGPDLRLFGTAYKFDDDTGRLGWQAGAEVKTANGVLSVKLETANDAVNNSYQGVSAFVNLGLRLENLLEGKNPVVMPEPVFASPRNMDRMSHKVTRNFRNSTQGLAATSFSVNDHNRNVYIKNNTGGTRTIYVVFSTGQMGSYSVNDFTKDGWQVQDSLTISKSVPNGQSALLACDKPDGGMLHFRMSMDETTGCNFTQVEMTVHNKWDWDGSYHDGYNISLVNGYNYPVSINAPYSQSQDLKPGGGFYSPNVAATSATGNSQNFGVFGIGNDMCCTACAIPNACCSVWSNDTMRSESHPTNDPKTCPSGSCPKDNCYPYPCDGAKQCVPTIPCQVNVWHQMATGTDYTVTFGK